MKKILGFLVALFVFASFAHEALANEGIFKLKPAAGFEANCYMLSVFEDGNYRILGSCRQLMVPYTAEKTWYVLWARDDKENVRRLDVVERGKFSGSTTSPFKQLILTAEGEYSPRKLDTSLIVAEGSLEELPLTGGVKGEVAEEPTPTPSVVVTVSPKGNEVRPAGPLNAVGRVLVTIAKIVGIGLVILLIVVVVMTIITRRKEQ